jgi:hypothetical protein
MVTTGRQGRKKHRCKACFSSSSNPCLSSSFQGCLVVNASDAQAATPGALHAMYIYITWKHITQAKLRKFQGLT